MKHLVLIAFAMTLALGCSEPKKTKNAQYGEAWSTKMQKTGQAAKELLPYLYSDKAFAAKKNRKKVKDKIDRFTKSIHQIPMKQARALLGDDPYVLSSLSGLKDITARAKLSYSQQGFRNSQVLLQSAMGTCFKCHTRTEFGPTHYPWADFDVSSLNIGPMEKAKIHISMRQYDQAKANIEKYLSKARDWGKFNIEYENAIRNYLTILIKGQLNLDEAKKLITRELTVSKLPLPLQENFRYWRNDLKYWSKTKEQLAPSVSATKSMLNNRKNQAKYPEHNFISDLVASSLLHKALMKKITREEKSQAYLYLGDIYSSISTSGYWDLPEIYFEMCIKYTPNSKLAKECYQKYRQKIVDGYTGSRGTLIPGYEYKKLDSLRKKAGL